jgi:hypothetical protein
MKIIMIFFLVGIKNFFVKALNMLPVFIYSLTLMTLDKKKHA